MIDSSATAVLNAMGTVSLAPSVGKALPEADADFAFQDGEIPGAVVQFDATEALSELYELRIELLLEDRWTELSSWAGRRATLRLTRSDGGRSFSGLVRRVEQLHHTMDDKALVRLYLVPHLWLLSLRSDNRVFHHLNALEIVQKVLSGVGLYVGDALVVRVGSGGSVPCLPRNYCVQYGETDLDFVKRLLEEEGLTFYFEHEGGKEKLVLVDGALGTSGGGFRDACVSPGRGRAAEWLEGPRRSVAQREAVHKLDAAVQLTTEAVVLADFDFTNYLKREAVRVERPRGRAGSPWTRYEDHARFVFVDHEDTLTRAALPTLRPTPGAGPAPQYDEHSGPRSADLRLEEHRATVRSLHGESSVTGLGAGSVLDVLNHPTLDETYLLTRVEHYFRAEDLLVEGSERRPATERYHNRFVCMPRSVVYRPERKTPRPRIHGVQSATVVGAPGDELHTDYYGRVKVQFHWDRQSACHENDFHSFPGHTTEDSAHDPARHCWVRVAQTWAGRGWGTMFIPRVGMEVVVTFEHGDPDRPLVVGCVYNDANIPPYELPTHATRSTIRTQSTPHTGHEAGFNELRFEDASRREEIYLHAQRDFNEHVERDHTTRVDGDQKLQVQGTQDTVVSGSQSNQVGGSRVHSVAGSEVLTVMEDQRAFVVGHRELTVVQNETVTVKGQRTLIVEGGQTEYLYGPVHSVVTRAVQEDQGEHAESVRDETEDTGGIAYAERRSVGGHRLTQVQGLDQHLVEGRRTRVDHNDRTLVAGQHLINAGSANLLVGDTKDADSLVTGYFFDAEKVRVGTSLETLEDMRIFRGKDRLYFQKDKVLLEAKEKELTLSIVGTDCRITLSADGKKIELHAAETLELKAGQASLTLGKDIVLDAGGGKIRMKS